MISAETTFWNDEAMVGYFAAKPADPAIVERLARVDTPQSKTALDLGCGGGRHSELLASLGFAVASVDLNPEMVRFTRSRLAAKNLGGVFARMSIEQLGFRDDSFDAVVSTGVLHQAKNSADYGVAVGEVSRVLKTGGLFTMNIFTNSLWDETYTVPDNAEPNTVVTQEGLWMTLLSKDSFYELAQKNGLELEHEVAEDLRQENTGPRAVLRAHLLKT